MEIKRYKNQNGPELAIAAGGKMHIIEKDGLYFKNPDGTDELYPYEDWRLSAQERARDLASRLSVEEIAGLMMYSPHQMVPFMPGAPFAATYDGKTFPESGKDNWAMTDQQKEFLLKDHIRHVLLMSFQDVETAVYWNNEIQSYVESLPWGIPVNISSDPRHGASTAGAEYKTDAGEVSKWPEGLGIAAAFDPQVWQSYGEAVAAEYRALGITTALSPQIDLGTEPRWMRLEDTFGTDPEMVRRIGSIYCDALQTTPDSPDGWGKESVCAMAKHWPGGGPCEGGRDAHYAFGKYAVYPGDGLQKHLLPFTEGAFRLQGPTKQAASIMPYYTVSYGQDTKDHKNVGNSYSHYLIHDLLREEYGYDGVVCTDWGITADPLQEMDSFGSRCYGVEDLTEPERHLLAIENGVDQFGGNSDIGPVLKAYELGCSRHGEAWMRERLECSARRLLLNMFRCNLFEDPYLDSEESCGIVGREEFCKAGYEAQLKSVVLMKNKGVLPITDQKKKVYIPIRKIRSRKGFFRSMVPEQVIDPAAGSVLNAYYQRVESPDEADFSLVFVESPLSDGYRDGEYVPISLQYRPYTASAAREESIAGGDFREESSNRSYRGKTGTAANEADLDLILDTKKAMGDKPVIVVMRTHNPAVCREFESCADAFIVEFGVQQQALLDIISGRFEPAGRLPLQFPKDMETVEKHCEDLPFDLECYKDEMGHIYDFGYGLNWSGEITDRNPRS